MTNKKTLSKELEAIFRAKQKRRKELAGLPFKKKIEILLELQRISHDLRGNRKSDKYRVWEISP